MWWKLAHVNIRAGNECYRQSVEQYKQVKNCLFSICWSCGVWLSSKEKKMHLVAKRTSCHFPVLIIRHYTHFIVGLIQAWRNHQQWVHRKHLPYTWLQGAAWKKKITVTVTDIHNDKEPWECYCHVIHVCRQWARLSQRKTRLHAYEWQKEAGVTITGCMLWRSSSFFCSGFDSELWNRDCLVNIWCLANWSIGDKAVRYEELLMVKKINKAR